MTQAYNLAILANAVDSSGKLNVGTNATGTLPVANGGSGQSSLTANNVILGNGTSGVQFVAPSTNGNFLRSNGTTWVSQAVSFGSGTVTSITAGSGLTGGTITTSGTISLDVNNSGATNVTSFPLGTYVLLNGNQGFSIPGLNQAMPAIYATNGADVWSNSNQGFGSLAGTWRQRGNGYDCICQRTA